MAFCLSHGDDVNFVFGIRVTDIYIASGSLESINKIVYNRVCEKQRIQALADPVRRDF